MRPHARAALAVGVTVCAAALASCAEEPSAAPQASTSEAPTSGSEPAPSSPTESATSASPDRPPRVVGTVATGLEVPWGIDFLPNGDAVVTERDSARVLRIAAGSHEVTELGVVDEAAPTSEGGLLGVAVSPDFESDRRIFLYVTTPEDNRIVTARLDGDRLGGTEAVLTGIPAGSTHDGGRLAFGPDGHLYASTGEVGDPDRAQDRDDLGGKILRITPDGSPAPGNPFDSPVWSYGHRNVQGLAWVGDRLWASEFGQNAFDELNRVEPGGNHGWPMVEGTGGGPDLVDPQRVWATDEASPSGLAHVDGSLWMAALRGSRLWRIPVTEAGTAGEPESFFVGEYGRMRTVVAAPDGSLWVTTSNHDGRGDPAAEDDRILRVLP